MLLALDVGNTNITIGVFKRKEIIEVFRITTKLPRTSDEFGILISSLLKEKGLDEGEVKAAIIGSVVPNIMHSLSSGLIKYFDVKPIIVGPGIKTGINLGRFNPREVGADRIVDLVAGYEIYGGPALVIDYGTATTYDIVTENGVFLKFPLTEIPQKKKNAVGVRGIKLVKDDTVDDVYLIGNTEDVSTEYCGKTIDLGRMKLAHRDTKGTKVRV